ncbi:MAG: ATP-binding protein [Deltaproteobacteria bacterium]|nr:ATP-binding protein [Deltaproteobacteria bacterium]
MGSVAEKAEKSFPLKGAITFLLGLLFLAALYFVSLHNYLIFHNLAEMFSIVIAFSIFLFAWNSRRYFDNLYFIFLGIAYFYVGFLDSIHTLAYEGMPFFPDEKHYATQIWIATRYMESIGLLMAFSFLKIKKKFNPIALFVLFSALTALILTTIFYWNIFPATYIDGMGLTPFKVINEYIICFILILAIVRLYRHKEGFDKKVFDCLLYSLIFTILSELSFTFYIDIYGFSNLTGHFFKIISFAFIYESIIATGLNRPYDILFRELKASERALTEANQTKDRFFSIISHDLKNPFTSLIGFSGALLENYDRLDEDTKKDFTKDIHESAEEIYDLLDNLLKWSFTQTGGITNEPKNINIAPLIAENFSLMQQSAAHKKIALVSHIESDTLVFADENMVNTVIRNLISNAIKYTGEGGKVTLSSRTKGNFLEISIADTGVGISEENLKKIFCGDIRYSGMEGGRKTGSGLGLILCKDFIERQGGKIGVESKAGEGSRFHITLPLHKGPAS